MNNINARLLETRGKALFTVILTARDDLAIEEVATGSGYDFIIRIVKDQSLTNRMFAAEVKATLSEAGFAKVQFSTRQLLYYKDTPFPVCLFFFSMSDDKGYYRWLVEPNVPSGKPSLSFRVDELALKAKSSQYVTFPPHDFVELNAESLDHLVGSVNNWYERRASSK